jgi:hypothetical protein
MYKNNEGTGNEYLFTNFAFIQTSNFKEKTKLAEKCLKTEFLIDYYLSHICLPLYKRALPTQYALDPPSRKSKASSG